MHDASDPLLPGPDWASPQGQIVESDLPAATPRDMPAPTVASPDGLGHRSEQTEPRTGPTADSNADNLGEPAAPSAQPTGPEQPASVQPPALREQLLRRFEAWLDESLSDETPPAGIDTELLAMLSRDGSGEQPSRPDGCDLYTLWSGMVALTGEIKLQGRSFKQLQDALGPVGKLSGDVQAVLGAHREAIDAAKAVAQDARDLRQDRDERIMQAAHEAANRQFLDLLLDLRDRLERGLRSAEELLKGAREDQPGWLSRSFGANRRVGRLTEAANALAKGCELSLNQVDESLDRLGVSEIACEGEPFDPDRMKAVDVEETADAAEGTVLEVYRAGYEWHGQVCRLAEVKVARCRTDFPDCA